MKKYFYVILESSCLCLIQRALGELPVFEVMTWQLCYLLRPAMICVSSNSLTCKGTKNICDTRKGFLAINVQPLMFFSNLYRMKQFGESTILTFSCF